MARIDSPLKNLIVAFKQTFAEWLLDRPVQSVRLLNVELPASRLHSDLLFEVTELDNEVLLLHIELQGKRSQKPMPWRMLDYMSRAAIQMWGDQSPGGRCRLQSAVIYVGQGAGAGDQGVYQTIGLQGEPSLVWRYLPLRL